MFLEESPIFCFIQLALGSGIPLVYGWCAIWTAVYISSLEVKQHSLLEKDFCLWIVGDWSLGAQPVC